jgi:glutaredoxin
VLKKHLEKQKLEYIMRNVDEPEIRQEMNMRTNGNQTIPVLFVDDDFEVNPSAGKLKRMLKRR